MIFSSEIRLRFSSASTVESLARVDSPSRSRLLYGAYGALQEQEVPLFHERILLPERVPCVVVLRDEVGVDGRPEKSSPVQNSPDTL